MRPEIITCIDKEIEYTMYGGKLWRVYRPFHHHEFFMLPMVSVENERLLDKERLEHVMMHGKPPIPMPAEYLDPEELRDYHLDDSFTGMSRFSDEEAG